MTARLQCAWCRLRATLVLTAGGHESGDFRSIAVCADHEPRARRWCSVAGVCAVRALPGGWWQTSIDGPETPLTWPA